MNGPRRLRIGLFVVGLAMTWLVLRQEPPAPLAADDAEPSPAASVPTHAGIAAAPAAGEREPALTDLPTAETNQFVVRLDASIEIEGQPETLSPGRIVPNAPSVRVPSTAPATAHGCGSGPGTRGARSTWSSPRSSEDGPGAQP